MKNKKPTMNEVKTVINNVLMQLEDFKEALKNIDFILAYYIKFKDDEPKFNEFLKKQGELNNKEKEDKNV